MSESISKTDLSSSALGIDWLRLFRANTKISTADGKPQQPRPTH